MTGQSKHILVVDDNGDVRDVIVDILQEQNYRVSSATGGSVMRDFMETGDTVDCVILDSLMPGEASASLALHLKERGVPVVMISGSPDAMKYAMDNGLQLLRKPFRSQELYSAFNRRSPAVSSDSDHKATVEQKKESANAQMVCVLSGRSHHSYELSHKQGRGYQRRVRSVGSMFRKSGEFSECAILATSSIRSKSVSYTRCAFTPDSVTLSQHFVFCAAVVAGTHAAAASERLPRSGRGRRSPNRQRFFPVYRRP